MGPSTWRPRCCAAGQAVHFSPTVAPLCWLPSPTLPVAGCPHPLSLPVACCSLLLVILLFPSASPAGTTIGKFLEWVRQDMMDEFPELKAVSAENLLYIKEDLIIPHVRFFCPSACSPIPIPSTQDTRQIVGCRPLFIDPEGVGSGKEV